MEGRLALGWRVIGGLAVLTALEYTVAVVAVPGAVATLVAVAVAKAWLIVRFFMHLGQLWGVGH